MIEHVRRGETVGTVSMFDVSLFPGPSAFLLALLPARATMMAQDRQLL